VGCLYIIVIVIILLLLRLLLKIPDMWQFFCCCCRAAGALDDMPIFVDQTTGNLAVGMDGNLIAGEDTASQNVLMEKIFGGKKFVHLLIFSTLIILVDSLREGERERTLFATT